MAAVSRLWFLSGASLFCMGPVGPRGALGVAETWKTGLQGTTFWDCNGGSCDAKVERPFDESRYVFAPQYAPADPGQFGGSAYGEKLWMTGAASDALTAIMGKATNCCGIGAGCGACLLVRNPSAVHSNWTAVVMKKNRCPPESKGCEAGMMHFDLAVPGYDNLAESTANVCGDFSRKETYLTKQESSSCSMWSEKANDTAAGCHCEGLPNSTLEQAMIKRGCEVFSAWGWTSGDPSLEFKPVACPKAWSDRVGTAFGSSGVKSLEHPDYTWWIIAGVAVALICVAICVINCFVDRREARKRYDDLEKRRRAKAKKRASRDSSAASSDGSEAGSESESGSDDDRDECCQ
mmetsp:Transcript_31069/g.89575  ORF Transcript_31069/g.89575 Transcript_31069/m.89575 type:complete len:349 (-) Transcript_31069:52-1098(-)